MNINRLNAYYQYPYQSRITPNSNPRFGSQLNPAMFTGTSQSNWLMRKLYYISDKFLRLPELVGNRNWFTRTLGVILNHDYKETANLSIGNLRLGRIVMEPPMGALVVLLFGFTLMGRLEHAIRRAIGGDKRELRDITCRDLLTFVGILFALKPVTALMSRGFEKIKGIQLLEGKRVFGYSELDKTYTVINPDRWVAIVANPKNHKGMLAAIAKSFSNSYIKSDDLLNGGLEKLRNITNEGIAVASRGENRKQRIIREIDPLADKALGLLKRLSSERIFKGTPLYLHDSSKVSSVAGLKSFLTDSEHCDRIIFEIEHTLNEKTLSSPVRTLLEKYREVIKDSLAVATRGDNQTRKIIGELNKLAPDAFGCLKELNARVKNICPEAMYNGGNKIFKEISEFTHLKLPPFKEIFAAYAKRSRVGANFIALTLVILFLGFGITAFNQWFTEKEFKNKKLQGNNLQQ